MPRVTAALGKLLRPRVWRLCRDRSFGGIQTQPQCQLQRDFPAVPRWALGQRTQQAEAAFEMGDRSQVSEMCRGMLPRAQPLIDRAFGISGCGQVMSEQFRLALDEIGEMRFERRRDASMQLLTRPRNRVE